MPESTAIPAYKLYGEDKEWPTPELLHHESIADRSVIHNWKIRPHRHPDLFQILYIRRGEARVYFDGREVGALLPCLVLIPPICVHGFTFSEDIDGHVITLPDFALKRFFNDSTGQWPHFGYIHILNSLIGEHTDYLDPVFREIAEEFTANRPSRLLALEALLGLVLVRITRLLAGEGEGAPGVADRTIRHLRNFQDLIASRYRDGWSIADYASSLGITATRLNDICRVHAGKSALQLVHDRIMLEAKRNLVYTAMTISEIAFSLGFNDPAYFSRFFAKRSGCSPSTFRITRSTNQ